MGAGLRGVTKAISWGAERGPLASAQALLGIPGSPALSGGR